MEPLTMGMIAGGANLAGSIFSGITSASNTQDQIAAQENMLNQTEGFNAQQAQISRDYETQMSNTAYQRASADMQKAGLNPAMMFGSGGAASTPGSPTASVGTPGVPPSQKVSPLAGLGDAVGKAVSSAVQAKTFDQMTQQIANMRADESLTKARDITERVRPQEVAEQTGLLRSTAQTIREKMPAASLEGTTAKDVLAMPSWLRSSLVQGGFMGEQASRTLRPAEDVFNTLTNSALRKRGLDLLKQRNDASTHTTEHYDTRPGGYTRSTESWNQ